MARPLSIIMQALVDFHGLFMNVYIGWPGKVHDARVLANFFTYCKGVQDTLLFGWNKLTNGAGDAYLMPKTKTAWGL